MSLRRRTEAGWRDSLRPRPPDDAAVMEALPDAQLHRQVGHRPAGVAADEVGQLLQDLHLQDVGGALVEGWQQGGILLEGHQGLGLRLQLEESAEPGPRRETEMSRRTLSPTPSGIQSCGSSQTGHCLPPWSRALTRCCHTPKWSWHVLFENISFSLSFFKYHAVLLDFILPTFYFDWPV